MGDGVGLLARVGRMVVGSERGVDVLVAVTIWTISVGWAVGVATMAGTEVEVDSRVDVGEDRITISSGVAMVNFSVAEGAGEMTSTSVGD